MINLAKYSTVYVTTKKRLGLTFGVPIDHVIFNSIDDLKIYKQDIIYKTDIKHRLTMTQRDLEDDDTTLLERAKPKLDKPQKYQVYLLNDDYTPMEFVVQVLEAIFSHNRENSTQIMLHVHKQGKGICGVFTRDIAETKVAQVNSFSRENKHPLLCDMEEI